MNQLPDVLPVRQQADVILRILRQRLQTILPVAMRAAGLDMWLIICQEDDHDPVYRTMIPMDTWTPILQMLIFYDRGEGEGIERINLSMTDTADLYDCPWNGRHFEEQWQMLPQLIAERHPQKIGINIGRVNWAAGGLTHNLYTQLVEALPPPYVDRLVSAEVACNRWLMTLSELELELYPHIVSLARHLIATCYSPQTITPGVTTTDDLEWTFWQQCADLGLAMAFNPFFNLVRSDAAKEKHPVTDKIIRRGDLIHCDVGLRYLGLCTDHQEWAYVLAGGETGAPDGLRNLFTQSQHLQQIFMEAFERGLTGNEMLENILVRARREGVPHPRVYSHSLGLYLHQPGPLIGLPWEQERCPGRGDVALQYNSCFTMEISIDDTVPEWDNQLVRFGTEQDVQFTTDGCSPIAGVQTTFHLI